VLVSIGGKSYMTEAVASGEGKLLEKCMRLEFQGMDGRAKSLSQTQGWRKGEVRKNRMRNLLGGG